MTDTTEEAKILCAWCEYYCNMGFVLSGLATTVQSCSVNSLQFNMSTG